MKFELAEWEVAFLADILRAYKAVLLAKAEEREPFERQALTAVAGSIERLLTRLGEGPRSYPVGYMRWTEEDDAVIKKHRSLGRGRWERMMSELPGRTRSGIKGRWTRLGYDELETEPLKLPTQAQLMAGR